MRISDWSSDVCSSDLRSSEGYSLLTGDNVRDDTTHWIEREMINTQLTGEHAFGEYRDVQVDWRAGHSRASRGAPYEKGFRYREDAYGFWAHDASQAQNYTRFSQVDERVDNAGVDVAWRLPTEMDLTLNFGGAWSDTERNAVTREFRLLSLGNLPFYERYQRSEEHTSELQSLMRISYAVFCLTKKNQTQTHQYTRR